MLNPTGLLRQLGEFAGEPSQMMVEHDPQGAELLVPISAVDDFVKISTGRERGEPAWPEGEMLHPQRFLYFLIRRLKPKTVLELGTAQGYSGLHLLAALEANQRGHLHTVELDATRRALAISAFERFFPRSKRWTSIESTFSDALPRLAKEIAPLDIIFEDGPHTPDVTLQAFERSIDYVKPGGIYLVDDITVDHGQEEAWLSIRNDPRIEASIEINARLGLCFRAETSTVNDRAD